MIMILLYIIGVGTLLVNIFSARILTLDNPDLYIYSGITESARRIGQVTTSLFLLACMVGIIIGLYYWKRNFPRRGFLITISGLLLYAPIILSSLFSGNGGFTYNLLLFPLFMVTAYLIPFFNLTQETKKILLIPLLFIYISLISIFLNPAWSYVSYSDSWIGLPIRLYGASTQPNGLGYIALFYLVLARFNGNKSIWDYVHVIAAIITLILSQSKTSWSALMTWMILEWIIKHVPIRRQISSRVLTSIIAVVFLIATFILLSDLNTVKLLTDFDLTLTGRTKVWKITQEVWLKNPFLGYGPKLWDPAFRQQYNVPWAGMAHNQFWQILGVSGLIGFLGLLFYLLVLIYLGSRYINVTNFSSLGLVILVLNRSFTETPLYTNALDTSFLIHAIMFVILVHSENLFSNSTKGN